MHANVWKRPAVAGLVIAGGLWMLRSTSAQAPATDVLIERPEGGSATPERVPIDVSLKVKADAMRGAADGMRRNVFFARRGEPDAMRGIREAAAAISDAKDGESKAKAEERLDALLGDYFEADMQRRQQELEDVEQRVKKLRAQLERRREKKRDIIELQTKVLLNEADGLGFFGPEMSGGPGSPAEFRFDDFPGPPMGMPGAGPPPEPPRAGGGYNRSGYGGAYGGAGGGYGRGGYGGYGGAEERGGKVAPGEERSRPRGKDLKPSKETFNP